MATLTVVGMVALAPSGAVARAAATSPWSIQPTANPVGGTDSVLSGVSCSSRTACTAVGYYTNRSLAGVTLAERWNGQRWSIERTPRVAGARAGLLFAVSCVSSRACVAVGSVTDRAGDDREIPGIEVMLAEQSNPMRWSIERTLYPAGAAAVQFGGVSCGSPSSCIAVGFFVNGAGLDETLAERSTGATWVIQPTPNPAGVTSSSLAAVSCTSPTACTAVGSFINAAGAEETLAERYSAPTTARRNP